MIIATITALILIFGGGSLEFYLTNLKGDVKDHVADKARQEIIIDASKALSKDLAALAEEVDDHFEDLVEVHSEYGSTESDFDEVTEELKADQKELSRLVLDARDSMHEQMTREEWNVVFAERE
jgi:peptidoglycan hydrolase CwlO-like protein